MGRQDNDPTTENSSIALLQERFRQLEKVKERREGKELDRVLSSESQSSSTSSSQKSLQQWLVFPLPQRPSHHDSLSLGLNLAGNQGADHNTMKTSPSLSLWPQGASTSRNFDPSDVDTSLHL